ncbi:MAG: sigma-54-dependent transcriptional regulator, partial [bacterium]
MAHILVVEDEINIRELISDILTREGHSIIGVGSGEDAITRAKKEPFDLAVLDLRLPGIDGIETMHRLQKLPEVSFPDVIIITAHATVEAAVEGMRAGAVDFLIKPFEPDALRDAVGRAMSETIAFDRAAKIEPKVLQHNIKFVGQSKELKKLLRSIQQVAGTDATVLLPGESGTGMDLVALGLL